MHPLQRLNFSKRVAKRAQYEALDIAIFEDGLLVRNESHANPANHEYYVTVEDGVPIACTCPADARFEGACKHRVAAAIRRPLLETLTRQQTGRPPVATDGGPRAFHEHEASATAERAQSNGTVEDDCEECFPNFPCWECYRSGLRGFP